MSESLLDSVRGASPWHLAGVVGVGVLAGYWYLSDSGSAVSAGVAVPPPAAIAQAPRSSGSRGGRSHPGTLRPNRSKPALKNDGYYGNPVAAAIGPLIGLVGSVANAGIGAAAAGAAGRQQQALSAQELEIARVTADIEAQKSAAQTGIAKTYAAYAAITIASLGLLGTVAYVATRSSS